MAQFTPIQWCDSAANPVMGCDGCELWLPPSTKNPQGVKLCYAGSIHEIRAGNPGYADAFLEPKLFSGRMAAAARWKDLRGVARPDKPWIPPELPRLVFISDMGDAMSQDVPFEFLRDEIVLVVAAWRHIGLWLTKQPARMARFYDWLTRQGIAWPKNLWPGTSVTGRGSKARLDAIRNVGATRLFVSFEPLLDDPGKVDLTGIHWSIIGGMSATREHATDLNTVLSLIHQARIAGARPFVKQLGSLPITAGGQLVRLRDKRHGGDWSEWPEWARAREFPKEAQ